MSSSMGLSSRRGKPSTSKSRRMGRTMPRPPTDLTIEQRATMATLWLAGETVETIGDAVGIPPRRAYEWLRRQSRYRLLDLVCASRAHQDALTKLNQLI